MADKIHKIGDSWHFECPGCGYGHPFRVDGDASLPLWTWNGSTEAPTFQPSLMVNGSIPDRRCHSIVTDGKIQFLQDSFHGLAGQTVDLPDWDDSPLTQR